MDKRKFKRLAKKSLDMDFRKEPTLIDITHDDEAMERVLKGVAEMQNEILKKAEEIKKAEGK